MLTSELSFLIDRETHALPAAFKFFVNKFELQWISGHQSSRDKK